MGTMIGLSRKSETRLRNWCKEAGRSRWRNRGILDRSNIRTKLLKSWSRQQAEETFQEQEGDQGTCGQGHGARLKADRRESRAKLIGESCAVNAIPHEWRRNSATGLRVAAQAHVRRNVARARRIAQLQSERVQHSN